jgi:hypothetical protein
MVPPVRGKDLAVALAVLGAVFGLGSITVILQDVGSCPMQPVGSPANCDHAYLIGGTYVWMRPPSIKLGVASFALILSALAVALHTTTGRPHLHSHTL